MNNRSNVPFLYVDKESEESRADRKPAVPRNVGFSTIGFSPKYRNGKKIRFVYMGVYQCQLRVFNSNKWMILE